MTILFRRDKSDLEREKEFHICRSILPTLEISDNIPENKTVLGRYSVLPFYGEIQKRIENSGSKLIIDKKDHNYIAEMDWANNYCENNICQYTPKTYFLDQFPYSSLPEGKYILKGCTNSRKQDWKNSMFAKNKGDVGRIFQILSSDSLIGQQKIVARQFEEFEVLEESVCGPDFTNEWRVFVFKGNIVSVGYYWSCAEDAGNINKYCPKISKEFELLINSILKILPIDTFVVDVAKRVDGAWRIVELNDFQMSGLSMNDPEKLYSNIKNFS